MPKRARKIQKRKRNVKRNVNKIKGLTAKDLLLNPALLQSPQFKQLPIEKQFQLISQLKQLQQMLKPQTGTILTGGGNADVLYSKLLNANEQLQQSQNETQRLKVQIEEAKKQKEQESKLQNDLKDDQQRFNNEVKHNDLIKNLNRKRSNLNEQFNEEQIKNIDDQIQLILDTDSQKNATIRKKEAVAADYEQRKLIAQYSPTDYEKAQEFFELSAIETTRKQNQQFKHLNDEQEDLENLKEQRAILQQAINQYNVNGDNNNATKGEYQVLSTSDAIKKNEPINESIAESEEPNEEIQSDPILNPIQDQIINTSAEKLILQDQIKAADELLQTEVRLKQQEELANVVNSNQYSNNTQNTRKKRILTSLDEFNRNAPEIEDIMEKIKAIKDSKIAVPRILDNYKRIDELKSEYQKANTSRERINLMNRLVDYQKEIKEEFNKISESQQRATESINNTLKLQEDNGITTNQEYKDKLQKEIDKSSPSKTRKITLKTIRDYNEVRQGLREQQNQQSLIEQALKLNTELRANLNTNNYKNPNSEPNRWNNIINRSRNSTKALATIVAELKKKVDLSAKGQNIEPVNEEKYIKDTIEPLLEERINAALQERPKLFEGEDDWINDIKPTDQFNFTIKDIVNNPKEDTVKIGESIIKRIAKECAAEGWNKTKPLIKYLLLGGSVYLAVKFMPPSLGDFVGKGLGKITLAVCRVFGQQAHQVADTTKSFVKELQPGIKEFKEFATPYAQNVTNYANQSYNDFIQSPEGQSFLGYVQNAKDLGLSLINLASSTIKSSLQLANATTPILTKVANAGSVVIDKAGTVVSFGANVIDKGIGYLHKGGSFIADTAISGFNAVTGLFN